MPLDSRLKLGGLFKVVETSDGLEVGREVEKTRVPDR